MISQPGIFASSSPFRTATLPGMISFLLLIFPSISCSWKNLAIEEEENLPAAHDVSTERPPASLIIRFTGLYQGSPTEIPYVDQDFMFAAIAEEMGSIFCICTILICMSCFIMFVNIAMKMTKNFYRYVALGLACTYAIQVFLTIGGSMKMIPMTGVTLPFVSSGGSSMLSTLIMFSVIQGLYILRKDEDDSFEDEEYYEEPQNYR